MQQFFLGVMLVFSTISYSQGIVKGTVRNNLQEKQADVEVSSGDGQNFTVTKEDGTYSLVLEAGEYILNFDGIERGTASNTVSVESGKEYVLDVELKKENSTSDAKISEIQVVGRKIKKGSEAEALLVQKKAVVLKEVIGAEELSRKGVSDAANAVSKIAGISKQEGTGKVYVRGLGDRYLTTTFNGLSVPSNSIEKKNIDLELFSTDIIENVAVSKTYSANYSGDFGAGNIDVSSKNDIKKRFITPSMAVGFNTRSIGEKVIRSEGTGFLGYYGRYNNDPFAVVLSHGVDPETGDVPINTSFKLSTGNSYDLGKKSKLSFFLTGSFNNKYEYKEGQQQNFTTVQYINFPDVKEYKYEATTTGMANLIYKINKQHKIKYNLLFINTSEDRVGYFGYKGQGFNRDLNRETGFYQQNIQFNQDKILVNQLLGEHKLGDKWNVDWRIGYNKVHSDEPDRKRISIENYDYGLDNDRTTNAIFRTNNSFDNQRYFQEIDDDEIVGKIDGLYEISDNLKIDLGYSGRYKIRDFENIRYGYKNFDSSLKTIEDIANLDMVFNTQNIINGLIETDVFRPMSGLTTTNSPGFPENTYTGELNVQAGKVAFQINLEDKWLFVPGLRIENVSQEIEYDVINLGNNGIGENKFNEVLFLPNLNVKYRLTDDQNFRFAISKTASYAEFKEVAPYVYEGITERVGGNPDLLGKSEDVNYINVKDVSYSDIYNLDLKYEWFLKKKGLLSLAAFYKNIKNPVNLVTANDATGTERFFRTGSEATVLGIELELKKQVAKFENGKLFGGLNASYMYTEQNLYDNISGTYSVSFNKSQEKLQGASPFILNSDFNYQTSWGIFKPTFTAVFNYFSERIYSLGSGQLGNKMEKSIPTLDFIIKTKIGKQAELRLKALNVLDPSIEIYREGKENSSDMILSEYKKGIEIGIGFNYKF